MMKRTSVFAFCAFCAQAVSAQSLQDAKQMLYYERLNSAKNVLQDLVKKDPSNAEAWYLLSQSYLQQNQAGTIQDSLNLAPEAVKNNPWGQVALGQLMLHRNSADSAKVLFDNALNATKSKNPDILHAVALAHIDEKAGDANYALELLNKALKKDKNSAALYTEIGNAYRKLNNGSEAFKAYQQALEKDGHYAAARYQMGKIFVTQKNPEMYLQYFNQVLADDSLYSPALYSMYYHYYFRDAGKAMDYFKKYVAASDYKAQNDYLYTDLLYLSKQYDAAIGHAKELMAKGEGATEPRLNKLIAYSYKEQKDSADALKYMQQYFTSAPDSDKVMKDYETMGELYAALPDKKDSAGWYFQKAVSLETDSAALINQYARLAELYKNMQNYSGQAHWLGLYTLANPKSTNVDLFNWALAHYRAKEYSLADTVFGRYTEKYPEQTFGYYWRARSNAAIDTAMEKGLAIPHYQKLLEVAAKDTTGSATNKKWMIEAYGYIAAYKTNTEKDYAGAIESFEKLLELDPENADAKRYIGILKKNLSDKGASGKETSQAKKEDAAKSGM